MFHTGQGHADEGGEKVMECRLGKGRRWLFMKI